MIYPSLYTVTGLCNSPLHLYNYYLPVSLHYRQTILLVTFFLDIIFSHFVLLVTLYTIMYVNCVILLLCHTGATDTGDNKGYLTWLELTSLSKSVFGSKARTWVSSAFLKIQLSHAYVATGRSWESTDQISCSLNSKGKSGPKFLSVSSRHESLPLIPGPPGVWRAA